MHAYHSLLLLVLASALLLLPFPILHNNVLAQNQPQLQQPNVNAYYIYRKHTMVAKNVKNLVILAEVCSS